MEILFQLNGLPELAEKLDRTAKIVAGPIAEEAVQAGGEVIEVPAQQNVHKLTGALSRDVIVVTRVYRNGSEVYALIGPGWDPENFRRAVQRRGRYANEAPRADQTTNPGLYGMFLEKGHRAPGAGLHNNLDYKRAAAQAHKAHQALSTAEFGSLSTPPYPWLGPAFEENKDAALEKVAEVIDQRMGELNL